MSDKASQITGLLAPTVASMGLELLGVEYLPAPGSATLRLYIDVPAPAEPDAAATAEATEATEARSVTIDDCEAVSREVSALLDVEDPISGNYTLEVSSPGLDRPLFTPAQFARHRGQAVRLGLKLPQDGRRRLQGEVVRVDDGAVAVQVDATVFEVPFDNIEKARLVPDWVALGLAPQPKKKPGARRKPAAGGSARKESKQSAVEGPRAEQAE